MMVFEKVDLRTICRVINNGSRRLGLVGSGGICILMGEPRAEALLGDDRLGMSLRSLPPRWISG
jgi:hypothetical protein